MNVIRMVKLFGWEPKMNEKIAAKREAELVMQRKLKFLELANGCTKCVHIVMDATRTLTVQS